VLGQLFKLSIEDIKTRALMNQGVKGAIPFASREELALRGTPLLEESIPERLAAIYAACERPSVGGDNSMNEGGSRLGGCIFGQSTGARLSEWQKGAKQQKRELKQTPEQVSSRH